MATSSHNSTTRRSTFRSKLNNVLSTPQGQEIQKRNWRVSDKFHGGFLKSKSTFVNENSISLDPIVSTTPATFHEVDITKELASELPTVPVNKFAKFGMKLPGFGGEIKARNEENFDEFDIGMNKPKLNEIEDVVETKLRREEVDLIESLSEMEEEQEEKFDLDNELKLRGLENEEIMEKMEREQAIKLAREHANEINEAAGESSVSAMVAFRQQFESKWNKGDYLAAFMVFFTAIVTFMFAFLLDIFEMGVEIVQKVKAKVNNNAEDRFTTSPLAKSD